MMTGSPGRQLVLQWHLKLNVPVADEVSPNPVQSLCTIQMSFRQNLPMLQPENCLQDSFIHYHLLENQRSDNRKI